MLFDDYYKRFILTTRNKCNYIIFYYKTILKNNIIYFLCYVMYVTLYVTLSLKVLVLLYYYISKYDL